MKTKIKKYHFVMQIPGDEILPTLGEAVIIAKNKRDAFYKGLKTISKNKTLTRPAVAYIFPKKGTIDLISNSGDHITFDIYNEYEFHHYFENVEIPVFKTSEDLESILEMDIIYKEYKREIKTIEDGFEIEH